MCDVRSPGCLRVRDLPRVERDGAVHGLLFRLYNQGLETLCGLMDFEADTLPSSNIITCVSCLALHDEDLAHVEAMRLYNDHQFCCEQIAKMHAAAVGYVGGPNRGPVEDIEDLKAAHDRLQGVVDSQQERIRHLEAQLREKEGTISILYLKAMAP